MRAVTASCVLAIGVVVLAGCGGVGVRMIGHTETGYALSYPAAWKPPAEPVRPNARFEVTATPTGRRTPDVVLDVLLYDDPGSLERAARDLITRSEPAPGFALTGQRTTTVTGAPAGYRISFGYRSRSADDGSPLRLEQTDLLTDTRSGRRLDVRYICRVPACDRYRTQATATLDSVMVK